MYLPDNDGTHREFSAPPPLVRTGPGGDYRRDTHSLPPLRAARIYEVLIVSAVILLVAYFSPLWAIALALGWIAAGAFCTER